MGKDLRKIGLMCGRSAVTAGAQPCAKTRHFEAGPNSMHVIWNAKIEM
jgi:hypothetical protein